MKSLIVYFSHRHENYVNGNIVELEKGNTQVIANQIHEMIESNIFEIEPLHEYPVHYHDCTELAKKELETQARPKVKNIIPHFEHYQKIYLGFPNWWSTMPMCVWTFLESYDFDGKDIYPFVTHEGSGFGKSIQDLKMLIPYANIHQGLAIYGHQVQDSFKQIQKWVGDSNGNNKKAKQYHNKMFPGYESKLLETDPEFITLFDNFAFDEIINHDDLDDYTRHIAILAMLIGCQGIDEYKAMLKAAYQFQVTPVEMKEIVYQATAYLGIGRVFPFLHATNEFLVSQGISLPLEKQAQTNRENRLEKGNQAQIDIFGPAMDGYYKSGEAEIQHIRYWLTDHCFGDYYTRNGLDYRHRELITFCFLTAQGGCEAQLSSHIQANIRLGNDKSFLIQVLSHCIPFIGFPRTLNALKCVQKA